jgi:hypothetical protein
VFWGSEIVVFEEAVVVPLGVFAVVMLDLVDSCDTTIVA